MNDMPSRSVDALALITSVERLFVARDDAIAGLMRRLDQSDAHVMRRVEELQAEHGRLEQALAELKSMQAQLREVQTFVATDQVAAGDERGLVGTERERDLLPVDVRGIVKLLTDALAVSSPTAFRRATRLRKLMIHAAAVLDLQDGWRFEVAALLSQLGCIALPEDVIVRAVAGQPLTPAEETAFNTHSETAARLLEAIPGLGEVAAMIAGQRNVRAPTAPGAVAMGAAILRAASTFDDMRTKGASREDAIAQMRLHPKVLARRILDALDSPRAPAERSSEQSLRVDQLVSGMVCDEDVMSTAGSVIVCKGVELCSLTLERLRSFADGAGVREPLRVRIAHSG